MKVLRALGSGIGITLLVALVASACLWFLGGYLGVGDARPFDGVLGRLVGLAVLWILALLTILLILTTKRKRDDDLAADIVESAQTGAGGAPDAIVTAELGEMRAKLKSALLSLRRSKTGRRRLYEMPWYVIIGPPGAGKTTAIVNSGLRFPLADTDGQAGQAAVAGVGGTRNCDWWFTDDAVLVDTAGRYTTQESDADADNAAWLGFLRLLKKHRSRQPINGAIVAISLSDLTMHDEMSQKAHATAVRRRLAELRDKLGVRFPVYVLFTKADLIAGFAEFFEPLGKEARAQVWGFTLPIGMSRGTATADAFDGEFDLLLDRLNAQSLERMQAETDPARRSLIASFPAQVASVRSTAREFLNEVFQDSKLQQRQMLRGVYFTSGTQEGTPIDRLMMGMARTFGIGRQAIGSGRGTGRSYFLTQLFRDVMFPEAGLVSADDQVERRYRWTRRAAFAAALLIAVGLGALWTRSYLGNVAEARDYARQIAAYTAAAAEIPGNPIADTDLARVAGPLNILADLNDAAHAPRPAGLGWGLYQGDLVANQAQLTYRDALNRHLLPRLLLRLEEQMQANINNPDILYELLKVYLTLGLAGPMNTESVTEFMQVDWSVSFPGPSRDALRTDLARHVDALLAQPMRPPALNDDLVTQVQDVLTRMPLAQRVYNGIIASPDAAALPTWRLTDHGGPQIARAFVRSSGAPLNEGVPGIFTRDGFDAVFLPEALGVADRLAKEAWVLGPEAAAQQTDAALVALSRDALALYYTDFIAAWDRILGDLDVIPVDSLATAVEVLNVLSGPGSPIVNVLEAVADETRLATPRETVVTDVEAGAEAGAAVVGAAVLRQALSPQRQLFLRAVTGAEGTADAQPPPGQPVEERFAWLHALVDRPDGQPSPLDGLMDLLTEVNQEVSRLSLSRGVSASTADSEALARFQQQTARLEGPLKRWAQQIASGSSGVAAEGTRAGINARWQSTVLPFCKQATAAVYPFNRQSRQDIAVQDFARLFGPGGLIDAFFTENLAPIVDTSTRPWTFRTLNDADLGISPQVLEQIENALTIRDAFFPAGAPSVEFQLNLFALDPAAAQITLNAHGQDLIYRHTDGAAVPVAMRWPGTVGVARASFAPARPGSEDDLNREGPWAWFRMLDAVEVRDIAPDRRRLVFRVGGRQAVVDMQTSGVLDPFTLPALHAFSCPETF